MNAKRKVGERFNSDGHKNEHSYLPCRKQRDEQCFTELVFEVNIDHSISFSILEPSDFVITLKKCSILG